MPAAGTITQNAAAPRMTARRSMTLRAREPASSGRAGFDCRPGVTKTPKAMAPASNDAATRTTQRSMTLGGLAVAPETLALTAEGLPGGIEPSGLSRVNG